MVEQAHRFYTKEENMSATICVYQRRDRVNKNNTAPLFIRITVERKKKLIATGISVPIDAWDEDNQRIISKFPDSGSLQLRIDTQVEKIKHDIKRLKALDMDVNLDALFGERSRNLNKKVQQFWEEEIKALEDAGKIGSAGKYKYCLSLLSQCNPVNIPFDSITVPYLKKFQQFLQSKGNCANSIATKFSVFQALYNKAISAGVFVCVNNPFEKISTPWKNTKKRAIRKEDIQAIINLNIPESRDTYSLSFARDIFLFSYYSAGINFTDIASLRPSNIKNGIVHYQRHKTGKSMCFPITEHNVVILNKYMPFPKTEGYIFPILDSEKHQTPQQVYNRLHKVIIEVNHNLDTLGKMAGVEGLTTYVARHTYATVMKRAGVDLAIISETMGHSDIKTTQIYLDSFEDAQIAEAMKNL